MPSTGRAGQGRAGRGAAVLAAHLMVLSLLVGLAGPAFGADFTIETAQEYVGHSCNAPCNTLSTLNFADDRANYFESAMVRFGETKKAHYKNGSVWASDWKEDQLGGEDDLYGDLARFLFVTGHGDSKFGSGSDPRSVRYWYSACKVGENAGCKLESTSVSLGEQSGPNATIAGNARFLMMWSCCSVHKGGFGVGGTGGGCSATAGTPRDQWLPTFNRGSDYVMGYMGSAWDSSSTDENAEDFAEEAYEDGARFKTAWFYANEDWDVDDVSAIAASGSSRASSRSRAINISKASPRRGASEVHDFVTYSWHRG